MLNTKEQKKLFNKIMKQIDKNNKKSIHNNESADINSHKTSNQLKS
jgi:hypothetical protein